MKSKSRVGRELEHVQGGDPRARRGAAPKLETCARNSLQPATAAARGELEHGAGLPVDPRALSLQAGAGAIDAMPRCLGDAAITRVVRL